MQRILCWGLWKALLHLFVAFCVWFTVCSAARSLLNDQDLADCKGSCIPALWKAIPYLWDCLSCHFLDWFSKLFSFLIDLVYHAPDWFKDLAAITGAYWTHFWVLHIYRRKEGISPRGVGVFSSRSIVTAKEMEGFCFYLFVVGFWAIFCLLVVGLCAILFVVAFSPICRMVHFQELGKNATIHCNTHRASVPRKEIWKLFRIHFVSSAMSALVPETIFKFGQMLQWWPLDDYIPFNPLGSSHEGDIFWPGSYFVISVLITVTGVVYSEYLEHWNVIKKHIMIGLWLAHAGQFFTFVVSRSRIELNPKQAKLPQKKRR